VALLSESFGRWADEIRRGRCGSGPISTEPGGCGDIGFYLIQVRFDALDDAAERSALKLLPTFFALKPEQVDRLKDAAPRVFKQSREFQRQLGSVGHRAFTLGSEL
jgi:NTE family protein